MKSLDSYRSKYPDLPFNVCTFFNMESKDGKAIKKTVYECCSYLKTFYKSSDMPQPRIIDQICQRLSAYGVMSCIRRGGMDGFDSEYLCIKRDSIAEPDLREHLNCIVYGFKYIYEHYKSAVLAIRFLGSDNESIGTGFFLRNFFITARHCLEGASSIQVHGLKVEDFKDAKVWFHEDPNIDLACIEFTRFMVGCLKWQASAEILDDVVTLGYPKIAGFHNFLSVEKAQISSRKTLSRGAVVAKGADIWSRKELLLISAKIQGGNSGGPVVRESGEVVGVAVRVNFGEGDIYDDLGYGTAIPIEYVWNDMIQKNMKVDVTWPS